MEQSIIDAILEIITMLATLFMLQPFLYCYVLIILLFIIVIIQKLM